MFSDYLKKVDQVSCKGLFGVAAGLVFVCQLIAMVLVVDGQVEKAQARDAQHQLAQMAISDCDEKYIGVVRTQCIDQVISALNPYPSFSLLPEEIVISQVAGQSRSTSPSTGNGQGFVQAAFVARQ